MQDADHAWIASLSIHIKGRHYKETRIDLILLTLGEISSSEFVIPSDTDVLNPVVGKAGKRKHPPTATLAGGWKIVV
ncbi:hypothetical protein Scep_022576 [Stephania cephalantha]|uniref:Uncharacterized protein n=1 Tax=Stephania cephalantha TaxID=152367 RepID=A0AAP0I127_9MAGN